MTKSRDTADSINRIDSSAADATAITIDASENVLAGKTSSSFSVAGIGLMANNQIFATATSDNSLALNRLSTDGDIARFYKDGSQVGSIGIDAGGFLIDGEASHTGLRFKGGAVTPRLNGAQADNTVGLGNASERFSDLYLGGGAYIGGTGSANYLDDYEEGTFTPTYSFSNGGGSFSYSIQVGHYTKVGRFVFVMIRTRGQKSGTGSGALQIAGLPFTVANVTNLFGTGAIGFTNNWNNRPMGAYIEANSNKVTLTKGANSSNTYSDLDTTVVDADPDTGSTSSNDLILTISYIT